MLEALKRFDNKSEQILNKFLEDVQAVPPPPIIYHYTNDVGLRGIIESGNLWFTDIFSLNDPTELKHGIKPAIDLLRTKSQPDRPEIEQFTLNIDAIARGAIEQSAHYFTCSFSGVGDELGQWRAYADNGHGYAIGFDTRVLEQAFAKVIAGPGHMTFPVHYGEEKIRAIHSKIIEEILPLISMPRGRGLKSLIMNGYMSDLSISLSVPIIRAALFFKHLAYQNEQEYRFMQIIAAGQEISDLKYRHNPYSLTRYREFNWRAVAPGSLKEIIVGPAADSRKAFQFANDCLRAFQREPGSISIKQSDIPYRTP